ncbi:MAG: hypothetical protein K6F39_02575 [Lachnospiraceae bacterium]|nr:hypothetical protein [Lachnospiraceae bacterium]
MVIDGKKIYIYGEMEKSCPLVIYNTFEGDGSGLYSTVTSMTDKKFTLAVISDIDWNDEMSR